MFFSLYPVSFFLGHSAFFETSDPAQHVSGWRYYAQDAWHFPLFHTYRLNAPDGVNIAFTDSIPLAALLFKPFTSLLPNGFHYFGIWHALAYLTQAIAASFLIRSFGVRHLPGLLAAVMLSLLWPALLWRLAHTSLMTHSVLLGTLGCYVRGREGGWPTVRAALGMITISLLALMIHPYLFAMAYSMFLMFLLEQGLRDGRRMLGKALLMLAGSAAATLGIAAMLGYLGKGSTTDGFGAFSMNLLAPICSGALFQCATLAPSGPQGEGVNYLGAGVLALMVIAVINRHREILRLVRTYPVLTVGMIGFTLYALSNRIFADTDLLVSYQMPAFANTLINTFRASGRFFWPVGYGLLFATLAILLRRPTAWMLPVLAASIVLQWIDVAPYRESVRHFTHLPSTNDMKPWQAAMDGVKQINIYPAYDCDSSSESIYSFFQRLGASYATTINTGHVARYTPNCPLSSQHFDARFSADQLYVMSVQQLQHPLLIRNGFRQALRAGQCGVWEEVVLCRTQGNPDVWGEPLNLMKIDAGMLRQQALHWDGAKLPTLIGKPVGARMALATPEAAGFLTFGPYVALLPGRYSFALHYQGDAPPDITVGQWDVQYTDADQHTTEIAAGPLRGTNGKAETINGIIDVPIGHTGKWEIRTIIDGKRNVEVIGIDLDRE